jgi:galactonate dehydratase
MKIRGVQALHCDCGWGPWTFVKVETDEGVTGWGECSDLRNPHGVAGAVRDFAPVLLGQDPRAVERLNYDMCLLARLSPGGAVQTAIAGIDAALWDIKGQALGVPIYELLGGPFRQTQRLYWSHCGTYRARHAKLLGTPPIRTLDDIRELGQEVLARGYTALKTNMVIPGDPPVVVASTDGNVSSEIVRSVERLISTFRQSVGDRADIALDLTTNFKTEGNIRIARALEPYNLMWLEIDTNDPGALLKVKESARQIICSGENLHSPRSYKPFFDLHCLEVAMIDVPWNGFSQGKKVADLADLYEIQVAPHNYYSHLSTFMSGQLCAAVPNVRIMEIDVDQAPWKDDLVTVRPTIVDGYLKISSAPGVGTAINEAEVARHPWPK